ncbi:MAG TPA: hypothetical protein VNM47_17865 [Terriglobia bacterium]|nr:hypothetical protein [Terriglobia bacterium]
MEILRTGKAPSLIRRKAAEGNLPVSLEEKIEILLALSTDHDETIRNTALTTLKNWDEAELKRVFSNPATPAAILECALHWLIPEREELAETLAANPSLRVPVRKLVQSGVDESGPDEVTGDDKAVEEKDAAEAATERQTLLEKISRMTVAEKINAALMGSQEERIILVRDSNKIVARAVLQSPKLSDQEVENITTMKNVSEEVLRLVATNRKFVRSYSVARNLINNPRTPIDTGLPLIHRLNDRDLKELSRNKNVAEVIRSMANKLVKQKEQANKPRIPGKH